MAFSNLFIFVCTMNKVKSISIIWSMLLLLTTVLTGNHVPDIVIVIAAVMVAVTSNDRERQRETERDREGQTDRQRGRIIGQA